ncbi:MAG: prepilin-type N-terminal cleavage/methylation domain-containing protein [Bacteriovoracia bacterium]
MLSLRYNKSGGFTLLEVMIAITIMAIAFAAILSSQSGSINLTKKSKDLNVASWLAKNLMVESEHLFEGKQFSELPKEESKAFGAPFNNYKWKREVREIKFPDFTPPQKEGEGLPEPVRLLGKSVSKYLENSIRELVVTISWERPTPKGPAIQELVLTTYLIDLSKEFNFGI